MPIEPFDITFAPAADAVNLLAQIANDAASPYAEQAAAIIEKWRASLAKPWQIAMVETSEELEIDDAGAAVSEGEDGFFVQTWSWVECAKQDQDEIDEEMDAEA
jgi:hypothetical protein